MEEFGDIGSKLGDLISNLATQLSDTTTQVETLERLSKKLVPENELPGFLREVRTINGNGNSQSQTSVDAETQMIRNLEVQRSQLVMDIQKQEYIRQKISELVNHNSEMVYSVKEYMENKPKITKDDYTAINNRVVHYVDDFLKSNILSLHINNVEMKKNLQSVELLMEQLRKQIEQNYEILSSTEYQENLNQIIQKLNQIHHTFVSS
ncbi:hypothetical protein PSN45_003198 [Yamadazyma tenuis]|uniref:Uncharacterized protein n=1 Tax=Candida tenuis (strain ATCC 10573 / BCRC 21748 / CBS 615 / JCM 9827 / NBRC 10315 / NRRL Y-1498 / VKM Y-70) TaxID=590646 RepID=G3AZ22_CANTC|nr:uncharacterized protein CANTEDRAFT_112860 [Yamadazyma tenuis ATCC 10573]XP_006684848.1 uncharacterized protein CANTEDRAFT_112860 [Yamadazyma tenuis ATCC 10573]EGV66273.1 hypothetical protein CANTEDRAFT_112860 [Yamadazyma tenuis ATCC 10573]EGV66274.1 hypothetical protein CANTEDRAFT_112860 [Yamadazyma tenuis ATCC 10573]WEJ95674.1 hypothetical protein PSN45_003198 [Yamadazyma tenuis]